MPTIQRIHSCLFSFILSPVCLFIAGCDSDDNSGFSAAESSGDGDSDGDGDGDETSSTDTGGVTDIDALYACEESDLVEIPLQGPGWDADNESLVGTSQDTYIVHTTQLLVKPEQMTAFDELSDDITAQLMQTPGVIAVGFAFEPSCGFFRTTGIWESQEAMMNFVVSGAHLEAIKAYREVAITGRTTHFEVAATELPVAWNDLIDAIADEPPY